MTVYEGEQAAMSIAAENAASYQWQICYNDGNGWKDKPGANTPTYISSPIRTDCAVSFFVSDRVPVCSLYSVAPGLSAAPGYIKGYK